MNERNIQDDSGALDQRALDRLVDGELDAEARRELLLSLDARPDGWRRCALAFLEAQSWGRTMKGLVETGDNAESGTVDESESGRVRAPASKERDSLPLGRAAVNAASVERAPRNGFHGAGWLAVAAGLLLAFTLGIALGPFAPWNSGSTAPPELQLAGESRVNSDRELGASDSRMVAGPSVEAGEGAFAYDSLSNLATFVLDEGPGQPRQRVVAPLIPAERIDERLQWHGEGAIPRATLRVLQRAGHRVQTQRRYAPIELGDGRRMIVPVDDVEITPVKMELY